MRDGSVILLIEDNSLDAKIIKDTLEESGAGFKIELVDRLSEAYQRIQHQDNPLDAILLDLSLPDSHGLETFMRLHDKVPHIPIVILTSLDDETVGMRAVQEGAQDYLLKGQVNAQLLKRSIQYAIERKAAEQKLAEAYELNKRILSASTLGTVTFNSSGKCIYVNDAASKIIEVSVADMLSQNFHSLESWKKGGLYDIVLRVLKTGNSEQQEFHFYNSFGKEVWIDCYLASFLNAGEKHLLMMFSDVRKRKKAESLVRENQKRYQSLFEDSPMAIWEEDFSEVKKALDRFKAAGIKDFHAFFEKNPKVVRDLASKVKVTGINKAVLELHGAQYEEQLVKNSSIIYNENTFRILAKELALIAEGNVTFDLEQQLSTINGESKFVILRWSVAAGYESSLSRVLVLAIDITERKKAENALQVYRNHLEKLVEIRTTETERAKRKNELILNTITEGVFGLNMEGKLTFINPAASEMIGWSIHEALNINVHPFIHHTRIDGSTFLIEECPIQNALIRGEAYQTADDLFWRRDGSSFSVEYTCNPMWEDDKLVGSVVVFRDITLKKQADLEFRQSEERFRMLASNASDIIWTMDEACRLTYISPSVERQRGYTAEETMGQSFDEMFTPSSVVKIKERLLMMTEKLKNGIRVEENHVELEEYRKDGSTYWVDANYNGMYDDNQKFIGILGISREITDSIKLIQELRDAKAAAESATKMKSEFLANMSHEIRTPMNAILGFSDLLKASVLNDKQRSQLESIHSSAGSLLVIINDILDLSKIEAGKLQLEYQPVNLHFLISEVENIFSLKMKEKNLPFFIRFKDEIPTSLLLDEVRLRQVLFNLVGNAVKFTDEGYISFSVEKRSKDISDRIDLIFIIEDSGIGIAPDQQQLIFEAFNQQEGQNNKKYGGTGLGLTITKRLVEMMGGEITLKSEPSKGSTFEVILHNVEVSSSEVLVRKDSILDPASVIFEKATILICDGNSTNRKLLTDLLEDSQLTILQAKDGNQAIELAMTHKPDVILMDLNIPFVSSKDAIIALKKGKETKSIPIIAISSYASNALKEENGQRFSDDFLLKPVKLSEVLESMKKFLKYRTRDVSINDLVKMDGALSDEQKNQLPALLDLLEKEHLPKYNEVLQNQRIDIVDSFGKSLIEAGSSFSFPYLTDYGSAICSYADSFEVDKLLETLKEFPLMVEKLRNCKD